MNLKDVSFGAPAAERDIKRDLAKAVDFTRGLMEYFVESETYRSVESGKTKILIGSRGSGKSAIFQVLAARERRQGKIVIEVSHEDYSYEDLGDRLKRELAGNWGKQGAYTLAWKRVLYVSAMREVADRITSIRTKALKRIKSYLQDNYSEYQGGKVEQFVSFMKRIQELKIGPVGLYIKTRELDHLYKLGDLEKLLPDLAEVCESKPTTILVDELDHGWVDSEDARQFVAGLFAAAMSVNKLTPHLQVMISLRRELYDNIPEIYEDAQKVRDLLRYVEWDEVGLKALIERRIRASSFIGSSAHGDAWTSLFVATMPSGNEPTFKYMVDRTLYRPRELIQFCNQCIEQSPNGATIIDGPTITAAERIYSRDRAQDIAAEYRFEYIGLGDVFETFRGGNCIFSKDDLEFHCLQILEGDKRCLKAKDWLAGKPPSELIQILWRVGFLKAFVDEANVGGIAGSAYVGSHQMSTLNLPVIESFQIHEMFHSHYGIKINSN
jgi:energy-coupling factor transporter ATP-binding protein EcfA2